MTSEPSPRATLPWPADLRRFATTGLLVILGYGAAVAVSVPLASILMEFLGMVDTDLSVRGLLRENPPAFIFFGLVITALTALPGFVATLGCGRYLDWRSAAPYVLAGGVDAMLAMAIMHGTMPSGTILPWSIIVASIPAGLAGGLAFWFVAGRTLSDRRQAPGR